MTTSTDYNVLMFVSEWFAHDLSASHLLSVCLQVMKLCGQMVEAGQNYTSCNQLFLSGLAEFTAYHKSDGVVLVSTDVWRVELSDQTALADLWLCVCVCVCVCVSVELPASVQPGPAGNDPVSDGERVLNTSFSMYLCNAKNIQYICDPGQQSQS